MATFKERIEGGKAVVEATGPQNVLIRHHNYDPTDGSRLQDTISQVTPDSMRLDIENLLKQEGEIRQAREDIEFMLELGEKAIAESFPHAKDKLASAAKAKDK